MYYQKLPNRKSCRLKGWDYSWDGLYYVTICTKYLECYFGDVVDQKMILSNMGKIIADEWQKTKIIRENVDLDKWVVMPNHVHGIIIIDNGSVRTHCNASVRRKEYKNKFGPQSNNVSAIIRGFKGACSKKIHKIYDPNFAWHTRFYDHIIRDEKDLNRIRQYIINNPKNWDNDKNNPCNL